MKKIFSIILTILIIGATGVWLYLLFQDYVSLPRDAENYRFTLFHMKSLLFTIFVIASLCILMFTQMAGIRHGDVPSPKSTRPSDLERFSAINTEKDAVNVVANLEVVRKLLHNNLETIDKMWEGYSEHETQENIDTVSEEVLLAELAAQTALIKTESIKGLLDKLVDVSAEITGSQRVSLFLANASRDKLRLIKGFGWENRGENIEIDVNDGIAGYAFTQNKRIYVTNIETHPEIGRKNKPQYKSKSFIIFPIKLFYEENVLGVLNITEKSDGEGIYTMEDLEKMNILMNSFALKMENMVLKDEMTQIKNN